MVSNVIESVETIDEAMTAMEPIFVNLAATIAEFEPVTMLVSNAQYINARTRLPDNIRVLEMSNDRSSVCLSGSFFKIKSFTKFLSFDREYRRRNLIWWPDNLWFENN